MTGVLPRTPLAVERQRLALRLPDEFAALGGERILGRLRALSRLIGRDPVMLMGGVRRSAGSPFCSLRSPAPNGQAVTCLRFLLISHGFARTDALPRPWP